MATKSLTFKQISGITAGEAFTVNAFANDKTVTAFVGFQGITDKAVTYTKFTPKIGSVKVGGQNWLSTEIIKITYEMAVVNWSSMTYTTLSSQGFAASSHQVSEKDGTVSKSIDISGNYSLNPTASPAMDGIGYIITIESTQNLVGCKVVMSDFQLVAEYTVQKYDVTIQSQNVNEGTVTPEGTFSYEYGSKVQVKATPKKGYAFKKWASWTSFLDTPENSESETATFTIVGSTVITAYFDYVGINNIYVGTSKPSKIYFGTQEVKEVYVGTTKVYG